MLVQYHVHLLMLIKYHPIRYQQRIPVIPDNIIRVYVVILMQTNDMREDRVRDRF